MMEKADIDWNVLSDVALLEKIGQFVQQSRLRQNKSQQQIADDAGVNRSTVSQIENGHGGTLLSLIQILRVLNHASFLKVFQVEEKVSPLYLAKMELKKRKRARSPKGPKPYELPDW